MSLVDGEVRRKLIGGGACLLLAIVVVTVVVVERRPHEAELEIPSSPRRAAAPPPAVVETPAPPRVESLAQESIRRGLNDAVAPAGLLPATGADTKSFRLATPAESIVLGSELLRQARVLTNQTRMLEQDARGERSPAMVLALEKEARHAAAAAEVHAGRVFVRHGPVPEAAVRESRARDGAVVLIDEGSLHGAVFLDPALHRSWAALRDEWRTSGAMAYDAPRFSMPRPGSPGTNQPSAGGSVPPGERR